MPLKKDEAIVLSKRHFGESDRMVNLLTLKSGKIVAIAKGANKSIRRFMNALEPFYVLSVEYFDKHTKGITRLENASVILDSSGIEKDLRRFSLAFFILEMADKLTREREPHPDLYELLKESAQRIKNSEIVFSYILEIALRILEITGFLPNFKTCIRCGKYIDPEKLKFFSIEKGGVLCDTCFIFYPCKNLEGDLLETLSHPANLKDPKTLVRAINLISDFLRYQLDLELKTISLLKNAFENQNQVPKDSSLRS